MVISGKESVGQSGRQHSVRKQSLVLLETQICHGSDSGAHGESLDTQEGTETDSGRFHSESRESDDS